MSDLTLARQFLVSCAVREAFGHDFDEQRVVADELQRVAPTLGVDERILILRDTANELGYYSDEERPDLWSPAIGALRTVSAAGGVNDRLPRDHPIPVDQRVIIIGATRYALGRNTYICGMVAEELRRVAGHLDDAVRSELVATIEEGLYGAAPADIAADWRRTLSSLRTPAF